MTWTCGFPNSGTAETARVRSFASGLAAAGADVSVHVVATMAPGARSGEENASSGTWRGIPFEYMHGSARPIEGWADRRAAEVRAVWRTCRAVTAAARSSRRTAVILFSPNMRVILPLRVACSVARVPLVDERDEFPFVYQAPPGPVGRLFRRLYTATAFGLFDGTVVISRMLEEFVRPRVRKGSWIVRVPIMVDAEAFACAGPPTAELVGYAGNLSHTEELVGLVRSVAALAPAHPGLRACVMGAGGRAEVAAVESEIERLGVSGRFTLTGMLPADEMPARLCGCAALALPRVAGVFSSAGFPTKLGEYLATGRPVVVTGTGDIPEYLRPGVDAFVVPPGDTDAFTDALEQALYGPGAAAVGRSGQATARARFDPEVHMARVLEALEADWSPDPGRIRARP